MLSLEFVKSYESTSSTAILLYHILIARERRLLSFLFYTQVLFLGRISTIGTMQSIHLPLKLIISHFKQQYSILCWTDRSDLIRSRRKKIYLRCVDRANAHLRRNLHHSRRSMYGKQSKKESLLGNLPFSETKIPCFLIPS